MSQTQGSGEVCLLGPQCALCWWRRVGWWVTPLTGTEVRKIFRRERVDGEHVDD
jgi:hypothetical protein